MYTLQVFHAGSPTVTETHEVKHGADVLSTIPRLLAQHADCEKVVVLLGPTRLFSVDCKGNRLPT